MAYLITRLMAIFFRLLYHPLAWSYDFVAWTVSLGKWVTWVESILPLIKGQTQILELGFGPGHLQASLQSSSFHAFGLDESFQMARLASRRLVKMGINHPLLVRGRAENIPISSEYFDAVLATFPTPYIFQDATIAEVRRVLRPSGRLIVLLAALQPGNSLPEKMVHLLFQLTHQAPPKDAKFEAILARYRQFGFNAKITWHETPHGKLLILDCTRPGSGY